MRLTAVLISGGLLALLSSPLAQAQSVLIPAPGPSCPPGMPSGVYPTPSPSMPSTSPYMPGTTPSTTPSTTPGTTPSTTPSGQPAQQPQVSMPQGADTGAGGSGLGAQAATGGSGTSGGAGQAPMMGDLGLGGYTTVVTGPLTSFSVRGNSNSNSSSSSVMGYALSNTQQQPINARGGSDFKISDFESPAPIDRVFATYNYFDLHSPDGTKGSLDREEIGFEKTCLDGMASIGLRVPYFQTNGFNGVDQTDLGDLSIIGKFVFLRDSDSGSLLSGGVVVTVPTGPSTTVNQFSVAQDIHGTTFLIPTNTFTLNSTQVSPYVGRLVNLDSFYLQGFSAYTVPTDSRDLQLISNSVGLNFKAYQSSDENSIISYLVPAIEAHVTTPLNHRGTYNFDGVNFPDLLVLTGGVHVGLCNHVLLTMGAATSVTGPKAYDVEGVCQLNFYW